MIYYVCEMTKGQEIFMVVSIVIALLIAIYGIYKEFRK